MEALWKLSRIGTVLALLNLAASAWCIATSFDNAWHAQALLMLDWPIGYIPSLLSGWIKSPAASETVADILFLPVGVVWYFALGFLASRLLCRVRAAHSPQVPAAEIQSNATAKI
jgi:hypothetical protein